MTPMTTLEKSISGRSMDIRNVETDSAVLPTPVSLHSMDEHNRRALIGWVANRMGRRLQFEHCVCGTLAYLSFSKPLSQDKENMVDYLLYLASELIRWIEADQSVYEQIKHLRLSDDLQECLIGVYEEISEEIGQYLPQRQQRTDHQTRQEEVWEVYRDVIYAVTQKKFLLIRSHEVHQYRQGKPICEASIRQRADIPAAREQAKCHLQTLGISSVSVMNQLLVISEAVTNILKHAKEGKLSIVETACSLHVLVEDVGPGVPLKLLPNATLMAGYSTKQSLGQGFTLMMKIAHQVLLATVPGEGTTLILVFHKEEKRQQIGQTSASPIASPLEALV